MKALVIGGGITGLTAAYTLAKESDCEITLLEAEGRAGGKVGTDAIGDLLVERGADSLFTRKPWALDLAEELGMENEIVQPTANEFSMYVGGTLHRVPRGLAALGGSDPQAIDEVDFISAEGKEAYLDESQAPIAHTEDESIASFFRRRFGEEFSRLVAEPLLAGTHGGSPESLSMAALYPGYLELERKYGSLSAGTAVRLMNPAVQAEERSNRHATFLSFRHGMGSFVDTLVGNLGRRQVELKTPVCHIESQESDLKAPAEDGRSWTADAVILATPSSIAASMLDRSAPEAAKLLREIRHASGAIVSLAYKAEAAPEGLRGTGFLAPYGEDFAVTGGTWSSEKWPGRAPSDTILVRMFLGREGGTDIETASDEALIAAGRQAFEKLSRINQPPIFQTVQRWLHSLPQYEVGHLERLSGIEAALTPMRGLHLAGTSYRGVGIPDCVRQGREAARSVLRKSSTNHE